MKKAIITSIATALFLFVSCEKEKQTNTGWGEKIKAELEILFSDIDDLAYCKVFNCAGAGDDLQKISDRRRVLDPQHGRGEIQ